jgi:hypothetical protein
MALFYTMSHSMTISILEKMATIPICLPFTAIGYLEVINRAVLKGLPDIIYYPGSIFCDIQLPHLLFPCMKQINVVHTSKIVFSMQVLC